LFTNIKRSGDLLFQIGKPKKRTIFFFSRILPYYLYNGKEELNLSGRRNIPLVPAYSIFSSRNHPPLTGQYEFDRLHRNGAKKLAKYGPVVKEEIVPGENVVWIFRPEDIQELFKKEGKYPQRRSHLAIEHIRLNKPLVYNTGGLLPT